jgi:hypothetical protein
MERQRRQAVVQKIERDDQESNSLSTSSVVRNDPSASGQSAMREIFFDVPDEEMPLGNNYSEESEDSNLVNGMHDQG